MEPKIEIHGESIQLRRKGVRQWRISEEDKRDLLRFLDDLQLGKVNKGVRISDRRLCKYLAMLRTPLEFFFKATSRLAARDIERFEKQLSSGQITSSRGTPYQHNTKVDIRQALKVYLRWKLGEAKARELTDWFDTRSRNKTPDFLSEEQIERLYKSCKSARERFLIAVLFDSGARAGEFHNIRYEDIQLPAPGGAQKYVKLALKEEYSKTKGRTISLFWKHSEEAVRDYLKERELEGIRSGDPIFKATYAAVRLFLRRFGNKVLGRAIHPHLFRHSSATFYASQMNRQQLCIRYGWAFSSDMPDVYISRAGVDSVELEQKFANADITALRTELTKKELSDKAKDERIQLLETTLTEIKKDFAKIAAALEQNPSALEVGAALKRKRVNPSEDQLHDHYAKNSRSFAKGTNIQSSILSDHTSFAISEVAQSDRP